MEVKDKTPSKGSEGSSLFYKGQFQNARGHRNERKTKPLPIQLEKRHHGNDQPDGERRTHAPLFPSLHEKQRM